MPDHIIVGGDHQLRIKHFRDIGLRPYEIAKMLRMPEERVIKLLAAVDSRGEHTTSNS